MNDLQPINQSTTKIWEMNRFYKNIRSKSHCKLKKADLFESKG